MSSFQVSTDATATPVALESLKEHLRIDGNDEDAILSAYLYGATRYVQYYTHRQLITATFVDRHTNWPDADGFRTMRSPLVSVTSIGYTDTAGSSQTVTNTVYAADIYTAPGTIRLAYNQTWPADNRGDVNDIAITYTAGYGTTPADVPDTLYVAVMQLAGHWYENREPVSAGFVSTPVPDMYRMLLDGFRIQWP
jgi:uncharacterized phiE125 gp8 family phage protein